MMAKFPRIRLRFRSDENDSYSPMATYYMILLSAVVLGLFGLLMTFSASAVTNISVDLNPYAAFLRTLMIMAASVAVAFACALAKPDFIRRMSWPLYIIALIAQLAVVPFGAAHGGNKNWLLIPGINQYIQPSEFLKVATCLVLASVLSNLGTRVNNGTDVLLGVGLPGLGALGAVMLGGDMGTALIFLGIIVGCMWIGGVPLRFFIYMSVPLIGVLVAFVAMSPSRTRRVLDLFGGAAPDPSAPTQFAQGLWALGSGGLLGRGPGASHAKWNYLQEAHNDFILAIVGEEFGLVGTLTLLATLGVLVWGTLRLAGNTENRFISIASGGIATWLGVQALINVGSVTGLLPVIGVPFPLVSHGGSSFLFTAAAIGVLLSFARAEAGITGLARYSEGSGGRDPRKPLRRRRAKKRAETKTGDDNGRQSSTRPSATQPPRIAPRKDRSEPETKVEDGKKKNNRRRGRPRK